MLSNELGGCDQDAQFAAQAEADIAEIEAELRESATKNFRITHTYDIGNQDVYITRVDGCVDAMRAALYCQFKCEEWFGEKSALSNLGVAALLVMFYGFGHSAVVGELGRTDVDLYKDREAACGGLYFELSADASLHRDGLQQCMERLLDKRM